MVTKTGSSKGSRDLGKYYYKAGLRDKTRELKTTHKMTSKVIN